MNREMNKFERGVAIGVCVMLFVIIICRTIHAVISLNLIEAYAGYPVSEYMINFQGGFVRRGVLGELFYQMFQIHPFSIALAVYWFDIVVFILFVCLLFVIFKAKGWLPVMPLAIFVGNLFEYRRDFFMLILAYIIFDLMFQYIKKKKRVFLILSILLSSVSILIYEPSFFFIIPILIFLYYHCLSDMSIARFVANILITFMLPCAIMVIVCLTKGSLCIANDIWQSWQPLFDYQNITPTEMGKSVAFLGHSTKDAMLNHIELNYGITNESYFDLFLISGSLLMFVGIYYLTTRMLKIKKYSTHECILISDIYIFQFICLLPMFSVLSCDFGRTINYVIYTSLFLVFLMEKYHITYYVPIIHTFSIKLQTFISHYILSNIWLYFIIIFFLPFGLWNGVSVEHPLGITYISPFIDQVKSLFTIIGL